jgi:hypothetical protein
LKIINHFIAESSTILLNIDSNLLNVTLHLAESQERVKHFAQDKQSRALVIAKIDRASQQTGKDASMITDGSSVIAEGGYDILISDKVEYLGIAAHTIAFLKRENYASLDLKPELDIEAVLDVSQSTAEDRIDLSS